jgi:hypothetical protein
MLKKISEKHWWNYTDEGNPNTRKKTFSNATFSTTNSTWSGLGSSPGLLRQKSATNRLSHGNALRIETHLNNIKKHSLYRAENT